VTIKTHLTRHDQTGQVGLPVTNRYHGLVALPTWVPDVETKPAPMPLLVVQSFVNTWEGDTGVDLLADPEAGPRWLEEAGLVHAPGVDLAQAREVRESIRALLVQNGGGRAPEPGDLRALRALADHARLRAVVLDGGEVDLRPDEDGGLSPMAATLVLIIRDAQHDGSWGRLKACRNPDCHWAYYDRSHAGRGAWCDMAVCGNRIKNRKLRSRRSAEDAAATGAVS
jgi:predicted RNA-binding Zn ribbon-like protein